MPESTPISLLVLVDGTEVPGALQVYAATVLKEANKIPTAKVTVRDGDAASQDFEQSSGDLFMIGKELEIQVGPATGEEEPIFKGVITEIGLKVRQGIGPVFMVHAKDPAFALTLGEKNRYFYEATDADAIDEIVSEAGLTADAEAGSVTHQTLVQYQATDWDFIVMRAEANGQLVYVEDSTVRVAAPDFGGSSLETYLYGDTLLEVECTLDGRGQYPAVAGKTWSASDQGLVEVDGEAPKANKQGDKDSDALGGDLSVPDITVQHNGQVLETELQAYADAALVKSRLARLRGWARVDGNAALLPDTLITLEGLGSRFNGDAYLTAVRHEVGTGQWTTQVQLGMEEAWFSKKVITNRSGGASGLLPAIQGLHIGVVTQLEGDPDGEERILVNLPLVDPDQDGVWARIATLDAGDSRGTVFRPEIEDEVIVGFLHGDPRQAVMLGGLHSSAKPSPIPAADDNNQKGYHSREGMLWTFDDDKLDLHMETPAGNKVTLSEDQGGIFLADENGNTVTLNSDGITLESAKDIVLSAPQGDVKVEGINVEIAAQASFKADGGAGAEVTTSAVAVLKGSLVQIN